MSQQMNKPETREIAYGRRARKARFTARLLLPALFLSMTTSAWNDPYLGAKLDKGLNEIRPVAAAFFAGTSLRTALEANADDADLTEEAGEVPQEEQSTVAARMQLPKSTVAINRNLD